MNRTEIPIEVVERELKGQAAPSDILLLEKNPELWREHLMYLKRQVEQALIDKKAESIAKGIGNQEALTEFHNWKRGATRFKMVVERKLTQIKTKRGENTPLAPIMEEILNELRFIADLLEERLKK